jgi:hypothetical protein
MLLLSNLPYHGTRLHFCSRLVFCPSLPPQSTCTALVDDQHGELLFFLLVYLRAPGMMNDGGLAAELNTLFHMAPEERRR